jgi:integrase
LKDYLQWRQAYYSHVPPDQLHPNAKLNPTEKTLQWDISLGTTIIRWAHEKGYRGNKPLPTFTFTPKKKRVRPAFELGDYRKLTRALLAWEKECPNPEFLHTRQLLRDYVLILANSGMRTGEANNLRIRDVTDFTDGAGRRNVRFIVRGKTGERSVIPRLNAAAYVNRLLERRKGAKLDDWLFIMKDGSQVTNLIDQFNKVLERADMLTNSAGQKFTLYSLRHFYAVMGLRNGIGIYDIARNMGTSVQMIEQYYGKQATPEVLATALGGKAFPERDPKPTNAPAAP